MSGVNPQKIAFIHYAKSAGRYVNDCLCQHVFASDGSELATQGYKCFNSWNAPFFLGRDWSEKELLQLANNRYSQQFPKPEEILSHRSRWRHDYLDRQYVHNHHYNWSSPALEQFRRNGWFTFMFVRDPAELLCSLWTWARAEYSKTGQPHFEPHRLTRLPLDAFIQEILATPNLHKVYALPAYTDQIGYVAGFTEENFHLLINKIMPGHDYQPGMANEQIRYSSGNPGYAAYRQQNLISDLTHNLLDTDEDVTRVRRIITAGGRWLQ